MGAFIDLLLTSPVRDPITDDGRLHSYSLMLALRLDRWGGKSFDSGSFGVEEGRALVLHGESLESEGG